MHPQTLAVVQTRAEGLGLEVLVQEEGSFTYGKDVCGVLVQYPATDGTISGYGVSEWSSRGGGSGVWPTDLYVLHMSH